nr:uncharacterized protein LOC121128453 [Lepeophtheirus salmonis]
MNQGFTKIYFETGAVGISVYKTYEAITLMVCAILCQDSTKCLSFNYKRNECELIDKYTIYDNSTNMIYIREPCVYWNQNTESSLINTKQTMTLEHCILECRNHTNCNHVVLNLRNNICHMKGRIHSFSENNDVITAKQCLEVLKKVRNVIKLI